MSWRYWRTRKRQAGPRGSVNICKKGSEQDMFLVFMAYISRQAKSASCTVVKTTECLTSFWSDEQRINLEETSPEREWHSRDGEKQSGKQKVCGKTFTQYMAKTWSIECRGDPKLSFNRDEWLLQSHTLHNGDNQYNFLSPFSLIKNF